VAVNGILMDAVARNGDAAARQDYVDDFGIPLDLR